MTSKMSNNKMSASEKASVKRQEELPNSLSESGRSRQSKQMRKEELRRIQKQQEDRHAARQMLAMANIRSNSKQEDMICNQIFTRVLGGLSLFMGLVLMIVSLVIMSAPCCGPHWEYVEEQCKAAGQDLVNNVNPELIDNDANEERSCYERNRYLIVSFIFTVTFFLIGTLIIIVGECCYSINEDRDEDIMIDTARHLKWLEMEQREREKENRIRDEDMQSTREMELEKRIEELEMEMQSNYYGGSRRVRTNSVPIVASQPVYTTTYGNPNPAVIHVTTSNPGRGPMQVV